MPANKATLVAGIGKPVSTDVIAQREFGSSSSLLQTVQNELASAKKAGFDCETLFVEPDDAAASVQEFVEKLRSKTWDGIMMGSGVRSTKELTPFFKSLANTAIEAAPGARLGFPTAPDGIVVAAKRMFPPELPSAGTSGR